MAMKFHNVVGNLGKYLSSKFTTILFNFYRV